MSDFIQFVRTTVPIAAWTSTTVAGIRGQAQRLLPLVISSRRHACSVCGHVPSALPMVRARMLRAPSIYSFALQKNTTLILNFAPLLQLSHCDHVYCYGCAAQVLNVPLSHTSRTPQPSLQCRVSPARS
jgi:hypothetical protein